MRKFLLIIIAIAVIFSSNCKQNTSDIYETETYGTINGHVIINVYSKFTGISAIDNPDGLKVLLTQNEISVKTTYTNFGTYSFSEVEPGSYEVCAAITPTLFRVGQNVTINAGGVVTCDTLSLERIGEKATGGKYLAFHYDNPLSSSGLTLFFDKPDSTEVEWKVHTIQGEVIRTLIGQFNPQNSLRTHDVMWDLKDEDNNICTGGIYFLITNNADVADLYPM